ncbi:MAG: hypothetical protein IJO13_01270 [Lachnospiraceae bacterium]|nr:hypothetical protein [Lachnospiraceae bacterium]
MGKHIKRYLEFCDQHDECGWSASDLTYFHTCIQFLQHERLIHLLVLIATIFAFIFYAIIAFFIEHILITAGGFILTVLVLCYLHYYMFLENKTQYLYIRYEEAWKNVIK